MIFIVLCVFYLMCIYKGSLNEIFDDEGVGIIFVIFFDDLVDNFLKEKF